MKSSPYGPAVYSQAANAVTSPLLSIFKHMVPPHMEAVPAYTASTAQPTPWPTLSQGGKEFEVAQLLCNEPLGKWAP